MKISKFFREQCLIFSAGLFLCLSLFLSNNLSPPIIFINRQEASININSNVTRFFHMGQKRLISSLLWITTILESDVDHYHNKDLNSWMFLRFKSISDLEPKFYENYIFGGIYLSIVKDDLQGASFIYDRGVKLFPDDYNLLKNAAYHFYFEVGDQKKSYELYSRLRLHPKLTPVMLNTLARLESQNGNLGLAFELLSDQLARLPDKSSFIFQKIEESLYAIKAEIDLKCLNTRNKNCSSVDLKNKKYIFNGVSFSAETKWTPFRVNINK
jgi:hypothetical protein